MEKALLCLILLSLTIPSTSNSITSITRSQNYVSLAMARITYRRVLHQPLSLISLASPPPDSPGPQFSPQMSSVPPSASDPDKKSLTSPPSDSPGSQFSPQVPSVSPSASDPDKKSTGHPPSNYINPETKPIKKIVLVASISISVTLVLLVLTCFVYRFRVRWSEESVKLSGNDNDPEKLPPATGDIPHLETNPPANMSLNRCPFHRLNRVHGEEACCPSPELQPMPPLMGKNRRFVRPVFSLDEDTLFHSPRESLWESFENYCSGATEQSLQKTTSATATRSFICCFNGSPPSKASLETNISNISAAAPTFLSSLPLQPPSQLPHPHWSRFQFPQKNTMPYTSKKNVKVSSDRSLVLRSSVSCSTPPEEKSSSIPRLPPPLSLPSPPVSWKIRRQKRSALQMAIQLSSSLQPKNSSPEKAIQDEALVPVVEANYGGSSVESLKRFVKSDGSKPRLKPLRWDNIGASSDRTTARDQLNTGSFQLNEEQREPNRRSPLPQDSKENMVLDAKRSQNITIILRALNITLEKVSEVLLDGNPEGLGAEILEALVKMAPTKEEERKLQSYNGDILNLNSAERFLKAVLDIPLVFNKFEAMLYRANFNIEVNYLRKSFEILEAACKELKNSQLFLKLLEAVLCTENRMKIGTNHGEAKAFRLDSLLKLVDVKGTDEKTTRLHFVVQEIIRYEASDSDIPNQMQYKDRKPGLQAMAALSTEMGNVKNAAGMDPNVLSGYLSKLITGLEKIKLTLQEKSCMERGRFFESMFSFIKESKDELIQIKAEEEMAYSHVKEVTKYFQGDMAKEEVNPFRIFMVVRDFLLVLDQVCKDVHERKMVRSVISFWPPAGSSSLQVCDR